MENRFLPFAAVDFHREPEPVPGTKYSYCAVCLSCFDSEESFVVRMELPCVVLWRPVALDCGVPIPPEMLNGRTPHSSTIFNK